MTPTETNETAATQESAQEHTHDHTHEHDHQHAPALNPALQREVSVEVPAEEVAKSYQKTIKQYRKLARIPGFRAGKVPETLIRSKFARELRQEVLEGLVSDRFRAAMEEQKLQPVSQPQVVDLRLQEGEPLTFKAIFEVLPEFEITGYESVRAERPDAAVSNDEFESELAATLDRYATVEPVEEDRPLVDGDWAEIEFKGEVKDLAQTVTEEGATNNSEPISGEDVLIEIGGKNTLVAFTDALRGAKVGQELKFEADYPADFGERRLAGKTVSYDVTVKAIKRKIFPEHDAEFAKQLGNYESWDEFTTQLRENLSRRKKDALEGQAREKMLDELVARYDFPVPETFVQQQVDTRLERGLRALAAQGMSTEAMRQLDFARLREAQRDQAVLEVRATLLLDKIAAAEGITLSDEEMERELLLLSLQSRQPLDQMREEMQRDGGLDRLRAQVLREKTGRVLYDKLAS